MREYIYSYKRDNDFFKWFFPNYNYIISISFASRILAYDCLNELTRAGKTNKFSPMRNAIESEGM